MKPKHKKAVKKTAKRRYQKPSFVKYDQLHRIGAGSMGAPDPGP